MRIAYLILAHTDPSQLQRLINALTCEHASFFVHIDQKVNMSPFTAATSQERNVQFSRRRLGVNWGGFSIVQATLALMRQALEAEASFDYFVLLSGQHYPIKSNLFILEYFNKHRGREFIRYISIHEEPFLEWKINMLWFNEHVLVNRALHRGRRLKVWGSVQAFLLKRSGFPEGFEPYCGSGWWALTQHCVKHIVHFVDENRKYMDFYRYTHSPDEMFFHTIIMNSEYAKATNGRVEFSKWLGVGHRVKERGDNITHIRGFIKGRSAVLDERDFESLETSGCLFARKFTSTQSLRLVKRIDMHLLGRDSRC